MKNIFIFCVFFCSVLSAQQSLKLKIKDKYSPLYGAIIHFLGKHYVTDYQGYAEINDLKQGTYPIRVSFLGYQDFETTIKIPTQEPLFIIIMDEQINQLSEVVVSSEKINRNNVIQQIDKNQLKRQSGESLAKMLSSVQGVTTIQNGATIAKPVIHGLHSNRILILNNGVRQEGQQWGIEHAPEIDPSSADKITVIKGADAIRYGSDALGGVVLITSDKLPYGDALHTEIASLWASNSNKFSTQLKIQGGLAKIPQWAWRIHTNFKRSGDVKTARYLLNNTGARELNLSIETGIQKENWSVEALYSRYDNQAGIFYGSHIGNLDDLYLRFDLGRPLHTLDFSYKINAPKQWVIHNLLKIKGFYWFSDTSKLSFQYAYQNDIRREFNVRRLDRSQIPALHITLNSHSFDLNWQKKYKKWETELGINTSQQLNFNQPGTGVVPVIPNYISYGISTFAIERYNQTQWSAELGIRYDYKYLSANGYNSYLQKYGGKHNFHNITYTLAGNYLINDNWSITSNLGIAWRAPHVHELYSDGVHHGSGTFEQGNNLLTPEIGAKWINSIKYKGNHFLIHTDIFVQGIDNYIYDTPTGQTRTLFSGVYPIFRYKQSDALFRGADISVDYNFFKNWKYKLQASVVYANEIKKWGYFPFIPSHRISQSFEWGIYKIGKLYNLHANLTHRFIAKQTRFDPAQELVSQTPDAYHLFDLELGTKFYLGQTTMAVYLSSENILNHLYKEYTNRFRYYAHDLGRNIQARLIINF